MKKIIAVILAFTFVLLCSSCKGSEKGETAAEKNTSAKAAEAVQTAVDIDLTKMSSTMVYSEVSNIMSEPDKYVGKTIRAKGSFSENEGYYFIVINDATACCQKGLEFIWAGDHSFPADYPEEWSEIEVSGTFESYFEGTKQYYHINNAQLTTV
ncbi:MAG: hypothetical protein K6F09_07600 [Clostridiales bacterium]|nr:hypothetical protein [Clostridiales bacterium]